MTLPLIISGMILAASSGGFGIILRRRPALGQRLSCAALCLGAAAGIAAALLALATPAAAQRPWPVPFGSLSLRVDALAAVFLLPIFGIPGLGSIYGLAYFPQAQLGTKAARLQLFYGLITAAMALVVVAANAILFLVAWEVMALAGFFLVLTEHEKPDVQRAALVYLAATHVGTLCLFALFSILGSMAGSLDFAAMAHLSAGARAAPWILVLALGGFGLKAGLVPLHFWLPGAHAAAPSHVSAVMSGVLLKTGVYGLLRVTGFFDAPPATWGWALLVVGAVSGALGVAFALAQHDLKRLLAYHSVENIGIIGMGVGLALLGRARGDPAMVLLGFSGAALHVVNHAMFKSLLFLGAGAVQHATGTREIDLLGGLSKAMRATSLLFLVGAVAISGLPPLNGFVSEWLVALGALRALRAPGGDPAAFAALAVPMLAFIGGLAAACFAKVHGTVFLGSPRSPEAARVHEAPLSMRLPMVALALGCAAIGLAPAALVGPLADAGAAWAGIGHVDAAGLALLAGRSAARISLVALVLLATIAALAALRRRRLVGAVAESETWGCGYAYPTARMQYTGSSFAAWLVALFSFVLFSRVDRRRPHGIFPRRAWYHSSTPDTVFDLGLVPALRGYARLSERIRGLWRGRVRVHALLILATLVAALAWRFVWW